MAEVGSSTSSPGMLLHEWLDEEPLNDKEQINRTKTVASTFATAKSNNSIN